MSIPQTLLVNKNTIGITDTTETGESVFLNTTTNSKKLYLWTCPVGVYEVSVVCVGAGGGGANSASGASGGGGGGLGWKNYISVTPNTQYTIVVGGGGEAGTTSIIAGAGYSSYFINTSTVAGYGGNGGLENSTFTILGGSYVGDGGGNGGRTTGRSLLSSYYQASGGGGAGGYTGVGGTGGMSTINGSSGNGYPGQGGGGGGGSAGGEADTSGAGGGVGIYGKGLDGNGGTAGGNDGTSGTGGSGGENGAATIGVGPEFPATGGNYGGGGGASDGVNGENGPGGNGAVRLIWGPRYTRAFPDSDTTALGNITTYSSPILYNSIENLANYMSNYMTEYRNPSFNSYILDGDSTYIADGGGSDMYDNGNFTTPWLLSGTTYTSSFNTTANYPSRISYSNTIETIVDTNFKYTSLGYSTVPERRPLTVIGTRTGTGNPIGWQKGGNSGADGDGTLLATFAYNGSTINGFTVYAWIRETHAAAPDPSHCDLYILLGHPTWESTFGTINTFADPVSNDSNGGYLYTSGDGVKNILAITTLLSKAGGVQVTSAECQTVVQNIINRVKLYFGY